MSKKKIKLDIAGVECIISTENDEEVVFAAGKEVDRAIKEVTNNNLRASVTLAAIITALSYYDDKEKALKTVNVLKSQVKDYLEDATRARVEAEEARREIDRMKKEISTLRTRLSALENDENALIGDINISADKRETSYIKPSSDKTYNDGEKYISFFERKDK